MTKTILASTSFLLALAFSSYALAQRFTPVVEDVKINAYSVQELQNNGCPMPPINVKINPLIEPIQWDYSQRSKQLKPLSEHAQSSQSVTGLHTAGLNFHVQSQVYYLKDQKGTSTCYTMWPSIITLRLSSKIMVAYEASLLQCTKAVTEEHELKHQKVALYALKEAQNLLNERLHTLYAKPIFFPTYEDALKHYNSNIDHLKSQFLYQYSLIADPLNSQLDSPANYASENNKCSYEFSNLTWYLSQP